jgi:hypothetical protein
MFYPSDSEGLRKQVKQLLDHAPKKIIRGMVRGLVSPHAGYMYSGPTAAAGYATLKGENYETVVVISPSHRESFAGVSIYPGHSYLTPLGEIPIDVAMRDELTKASRRVVVGEAGHRDEHAIEVQLPFLQEVLGNFKLLPLVMGDQGRETCLELGEALSRVIGERRVLVVASTDLSHYHTARVADAIDVTAINDVNKFDYKQLMADLESGTTEACGGGPTVAMMAALHALGVKHMEVVHHCNSGDITGDSRTVVGYLSAVAWS